MGWYRVIGLGVVMGLASGCAGGRGRQDMARLQSQMGLLDERVTQLERSGAHEPSMSTASFNEPAMSTTAISTVAVTPSKHKSHKSTAMSQPAAEKPSTRAIQAALKNAGFYQGEVDSKMGVVTRDAIKEFQRVNGLKDDGVVGKQTWAKLNTYETLLPSSEGTSTPEVLKK